MILPNKGPLSVEKWYVWLASKVIPVEAKLSTTKGEVTIISCSITYEEITEIRFSVLFTLGHSKCVILHDRKNAIQQHLWWKLQDFFYYSPYAIVCSNFFLPTRHCMSLCTGICFRSRIVEQVIGAEIHPFARACVHTRMLRTWRCTWSGLEVRSFEASSVFERLCENPRAPMVAPAS